MRQHRLPRTAALSVLVLLFAACSVIGDGDDKGKQEQGKPFADPIDPVWEKEIGGGFLEAVHTGGDRITLSSKRVVMGLDPATGAERFRTRVEHCTSSAPNVDGDIALTQGRGCRAVALIDGATGERKWRTKIPPTSEYDAGGNTVTVGDRTVSVVQFCDQVTRLSLETGTKLGVIAPKDRLCANEVATDGDLIAVWRDAETGDTPDDHGTGWVAPHAGRAAYELYDADSGERLWRRIADREDGGLSEQAIVNAEPLYLALEENGRTETRRYSRTGPRPGPFLGRGSARGGAFSPLGVSDGVLVGSYESNGPGGPGRYFAYDLETGDELWSRVHSGAPATKPDRSPAVLAGVDGGGVVLAHRHTDIDGEDGPTNQWWFTRWDLRTGEDAGVAGWVADTENSLEIWQVAAGQVLGRSNDVVQAFRLPESEQGTALPWSSEKGWGDDEVRPGPGADPCMAVSAESLRAVGLRAGRPVPADCFWKESSSPARSHRGLRVRVDVAAPYDGDGIDDDEAMTATAAAEALVEQRREAFDSELMVGSDISTTMPDPRPLGGLGDEAYSTSGARFLGDFGVGWGGYLLVRVHNVVIEVQAETTYGSGTRGASPPSPRNVEDGVVAAAADVAEALGLDLEELTEPAGGPAKTTRGACADLDQDAGRLGLGPRMRLQVGPSDPRWTDCAWRRRTDDGPADLNAHVYAADASPLTGRSGGQVARALVDDSRLRGSKDLDGVGGEASIHRHDVENEETGYVSDEYTVTARLDNLVVQVSHTRTDRAPTATIRADAVAMVKTVLEELG